MIHKQAVSWLRKSPPVRALKHAARFPFALRADAREHLVSRRVAYELAVTAILKDEARFLDDWLTFHHGIG
jgi:hypothetical protein